MKFWSSIPLYIAGIILCLIIPLRSYATHERSAEITVKYLQGTTYEILLVTYTYTPSLADRPVIPINFGDGIVDTVPRTNKIGYPNDIQRNEYKTTHTYVGAGTYIISMMDPNRNQGVINVPNSVNTPMYVETQLTISPFLNPPNSTPVLTYPPIDRACVQQPFIHNPGAYDPDGDSLAYKLVPCKTADGLDIPGYSYPQASQSLTLDPITGDLVWDSPYLQGEYNVAIRIEEYRKGVLIGYVIRDMQIIVGQCNNHPPKIDELRDTCVLAGSPLSIPIHATDIDNDLVTLSATSGVFSLANNPAVFPTNSAVGSVTSIFTWQTDCSHVRKNAYDVLFKAIDNSSPVNLVDLKHLKITVIAPAPTGMQAVPEGNAIHVSWNESICKNAAGYLLYRRVGPYPFTPDYCETGLPAYTGYVLIKKLFSLQDTTYIDADPVLTHGNSYCYRVVAYFGDGAESYVSQEACMELIRDVPIITKVSIGTTDVQTGMDTVMWAKPRLIDSTQTPPPFMYKIYRLNGGNYERAGSTFDLNDTLFIDKNLNTKENQQNYKIEFCHYTSADTVSIRTSNTASSVFLITQGYGRKIKLTWNVSVPWINDTMMVYRQNKNTQAFDSIGFTTTNTYWDVNLDNGAEYCYFVKSIGHYTIDDIAKPLVNYSQQTCGMPEDKEAPCPPVFSVQTDCDTKANTLTFTYNDSCSYDLKTITLWYKSDQNASFSAIETFYGKVTTYTHYLQSTVVGCYAVSTEDTNGNKSALSPSVCVSEDSCQQYKYNLPNFFSPNGDGINDMFTAFPWINVEKVEMYIYNRYGTRVFYTEDPNINWTGRSGDSGNICADGTYLYYCTVHAITLSGIKKYSFKGSITLLSGK